MRCPACGGVLQIPDNAQINMESYMRSVFTALECCGRGVRISPRLSFDITFEDSDRKTDDWGREVRP